MLQTCIHKRETKQNAISGSEFDKLLKTCQRPNINGLSDPLVNEHKTPQDGK